MNQTAQTISTSFIQALHELRVNKLRTFLSLLGITIGIFCIIAVLTVLESMENNIQTRMSSLGSDVLYISRWPWTADNSGEYKWWEYWRRPSMTVDELRTVENKVNGVQYATLCVKSNLRVKYLDVELSSIGGYAVTSDFDRIQNIEISSGRYLSSAELEGGNDAVVLGSQVYADLFGTVNAIGKSVSFLGRKYTVVGVMKKVGQNMAGFDFDNGLIFSYYAAANVTDVRSLDVDPVLMVKAAAGHNVSDVKDEVEGALRQERKVRPGRQSNFSINQLSQISERLQSVFGLIDMIGGVIGFFSLLVGGFGIANIMFVTVKERTKIIGLKKAIGAKRATILTEFLIEAITLCIIGGMIGIVIVLLLSLLLTYGADFAVTLSFKNFFLGLFISVIVGVLSGIIPAWAASRLNPVDAIRTT
ncbi:ABC transporter permease [Taibaiella soli]|uniref:ABC transporter permease n=1 Tax=Taibaiella soli TaxID=1649169 RepID=A0A2W2ATT5_9BACT|nr:ABC transporter permease [Taibaiella soli]PZF71118.1 ABC transporter permease [Taibaiella soli]